MTIIASILILAGLISSAINDFNQVETSRRLAR
jgi:hypothetical protein